MKLILGDCIEAMRELDEGSVDAVVTDPPYGINFMGKAWDGKAIEDGAWRKVVPSGTRLTGSPDSPHARKNIARTASGYTNRAGEAGAYDFTVKGNRAFQQWTEAWATEAFRVLKPGGHLLSFCGTRTYHRMASGIEDAGFEIRDCIAWMYGSGFPKSLDVGKAIDGLDRPESAQMAAHEFTSWLRSTGITSKAINEATGTVMGGHYLTAKTQPAIPTAEMWALIRPLIAEVPEAVDEMIGYRAVSENLARREVVGEVARSEVLYAPGSGRQPELRTVRETLPFTPEAMDWHGWGTALKPAFEPIVVARKPLAGTVGRNVLAHGTGALNVDGCRVGAEGGTRSVGPPSYTNMIYGHGMGGCPNEAAGGRWPANVVLDEQAAAVLDAQSGPSSSSSSMPLPLTPGDSLGAKHGDRGLSTVRGHDDAGGASRFFYCAKVSAAERNAGLAGFEQSSAPNALSGGSPKRLDGNPVPVRANIHPTVKPIALMRWLVRLVTPPGGTVLDPFLGSGSTGCAAVLEGFDFIGCEREADYLPIAEARIAFWQEHGEDGLAIVKAAEAADERRAVIAAAGQLDLFELLEEGAA